LLLLQKGGETVYFGDIGQDSHIIREYFAGNGAPCPPNVNPAEYMLEAIGAGITPRVGDRDWKDIWLDSPEHARVKEEIAAIKREALSLPVVESEHQSTCKFYPTNSYLTSAANCIFRRQSFLTTVEDRRSKE